MISIAEFRKWRGERDASWMHKMIGSFLCFGNGGSFALDALLQNRNGNVKKYYIYFGVYLYIKSTQWYFLTRTKIDVSVAVLSVVTAFKRTIVDLCAIMLCTYIHTYHYGVRLHHYGVHC